ncbi:MAG: hypothetical protein R2707_03290 [Acidimicrobiales bacterium]
MSPSVSIRFDASVDLAWTAPIEHAFRLWAATRELRVVDPAHATDAAFVYGGDALDALPATNRRTARPSRHGGLPWYFGGDNEDHLAEIHAWAAALSEVHAARDDLGRVCRNGSMAAVLGVDPAVPWAERHLDAFDRVVLARHPGLAAALDRRARSVTVLGSHDIDFLPTRRPEIARRLFRNVGVATLGQHDPRLAGSIIAAAASHLITRLPVLGGIAAVAEMERRHGIVSTWNVIVRRRHARDAEYSFEDPVVRRALDGLARAGHEIGLHASYTSASTPGAIAEEMTELRNAGHPATGTRQHWLRHGGAELYQEVAKAGALYDSSFGWSDGCGFRHGLARPFVPFDTSTGAPATVVEVPLVIMDVALSEEVGRGADGASRSSGILDQAAAHGGTVSILWHDTTVSDTQIRRGVGPLYERLLARGDEWSTSAAAVRRDLPAWQAAGFVVG